MAKIVVFEDSYIDTISRYSWLNRKHHDVTVFLDDTNQVNGCFKLRKNRPTNILLEVYAELFREAGFDLKKVMHYFKGRDLVLSDKPPLADFYFMDGLRGDCLCLIPHLPKENVVVCSGDGFVREAARELGVVTCDDYLSDIVRSRLKV